MSLEEEIESLIVLGREGDYWDFKQQHHDKIGDLIRDIMCLANSVRHKGDRYLIFGVNDAMTAVGVPVIGRRTQVQIIDALSHAGFAGHVYPDVYLREIVINGQTLDILVIKDTPEKPFYLQGEYHQAGVRIHAGTIYARVRDRNTAVNEVASVSDIEQMWRERFGLDQSPMQRLTQYILDVEGWENVEEHHWHYKQFPEFKIVSIEEAFEIEGGEYWVRAGTNPRGFVEVFGCFYHQTLLKKVTIIHYDEMRVTIPNPETDAIPGAETNIFYSFAADSFEFLMLQFLRKRPANFFFDSERAFASRGQTVPLLVFDNNDQRERFKKFIAKHPERVSAAQYDTLYDHLRGPEINDGVIEVIKFGSKLIRLLAQWKADGEPT